MDNSIATRRKRTQRDYTMGFKLAVVDQVEKGQMKHKQAQRHYGIQGRSTVLVWLRKHGRLDWSPQNLRDMKTETPEQKIKRLEQELEDERAREPQATRRPRLGKSSIASGTRGVERIILCRRAQPPSAVGGSREARLLQFDFDRDGR